MSGQTAKFQVVELVEGVITPVDEYDDRSEAIMMADGHSRERLASDGSRSDARLVMCDHELVHGPNVVLG